MNESILLRFESEGRPLRVVEFGVEQGIVFDRHPDASPLNLAIGLQPLFPQLLEPVQRRHDWRNKEFLLAAAIHDGGLRFSGHKGDPEGLPQGVYDLTVEIESFRFRDADQRITLRDGKQTEVTVHEEPDRRRIVLRDNFDPLTQGIVANPESVVDGQPLLDWLKNPIPRASRKACLLNVAAKLRIPPAAGAGLTTPLTTAFKYMYFADVDRVYAAADAGLDARLKDLVARKLWVKEGRPNAPIHLRLLDSLQRLKDPIPAEEARQFTLTSYRQGGRNCLQIVTATPPAGSPRPHVYTDVDIDLGNPLWDLQGLIVHVGELLDPGRTDHLALHRSLYKGEAADFKFYDIAES